MTTPTPKRPDWAPLLDRMTLLLVRAGRRLLGRPTESTLTGLARQDRPGMAITLPPTTTNALTAGRAAFTAGLYADALHHFGQVLQSDPDHAWGWHGRGDALQLMGSHADALASYQRASVLQPEEPLHTAGADRAREAILEKGDAG